MIASAEHLFREYETLPESEKSLFAQIFWRRMPVIDSGEISDEELCAGGSLVAAMLEAEETAYEPQTR
ncbi:MAG: hypothetical protein ACKVY0_07985 [Prosthecobacter sp.]|uniref:hypothetical protein n=1 Tax=Prosthecobacter sp. TaxID=1965333 RepID=UPI0039017A7A